MLQRNFIQKLFPPILSCVLVCSLFVSLQAMNDEQTQNSQTITVQQFSASAIPFIPSYLFKNPYQGGISTHSIEQLEAIKQSTPTITKSQLQSKAAAHAAEKRNKTKNFSKGIAPQLAGNQLERMLEAFEHTTHYMQEKELNDDIVLYDWVYGLEYAAAHFTTPITLEFIAEVNKRISRLSGEEGGIYRTRVCVWDKRKLTFTERVLYRYLQRDNPHFEAIFAELKKRRVSVDELWQNKDPYLRTKDGIYISTESIKELMRAIDNLGRKIYGEDGEQKINVQEVDRWDAEAQKANNSQTDYINLHFWIMKRFHFFPLGNQMVEALKNAIERVNTLTTHPVERYARFWFDIVAIHPYNEAHKRTAKAIVIPGFLEAGYLPPEITEDDEQEYLTTLQKCIVTNNPQPFIQLIASLIEKTQRKYSYVVLQELQQEKAAQKSSQSMASAAGNNNSAAAIAAHGSASNHPQVTASKICGQCKQDNCCKMCSRCKSTYYCSEVCQKTHWTTHKKTCKPSSK